MSARVGRMYPAAGRRRRLTILGDVTMVLLVVIFALVGKGLHDSIAGLSGMASGVAAAGQSISDTGRSTAQEVRGGFDAAAGAVGRAPFVGGDLARELQAIGRRQAAAIEREAVGTGRELREAGEQGERDARQTARLVGWLGFAVPTLLLLSQALPTRLRVARTG